MVEIRRCTVRDVETAPNFKTVLSRYGLECSNPSLGMATPNLESYYRLEQGGLLHIVAAFDGDLIVGFATVIITELPHYSGCISASTESLFVVPEHRKGGTGLRLLRAAEALAAAGGASCLMVSAPTDGPLADVLAKSKGYRETNRVYCREVRP